MTSYNFSRYNLYDQLWSDKLRTDLSHFSSCDFFNEKLNSKHPLFGTNNFC